MWPILMEGLPKVGCLWMMPRAVVHGPLHYAGLNVPNLYTKQFLAQLIMVLWYGRLLDNTTGVLIQTTMESMKPKMGLSGKFFQTPLTFEHLMTDTWIRQLWMDCVHDNIVIFTDIVDFAPQ